MHPVNTLLASCALASLVGCTAAVGQVGAGSSSGSTTGATSSTTGRASTGPSATGSSGGPGGATTSGGTEGSSVSASGSSGTTGTTGSSGTSSATGGSSSGTSGSTGLQLGASIDALVGINGFIDDPRSKLESFGTVREYHDWSWNDGNGASGYSGYPDNQLEFSLWGGYWDFDAYYTGLHDAGVTVFPAVQGGVQYENNYAMPPVAAGADTTDPASYVAHADFMFQLAARYGSTPVADNLLKLAAGQSRLSGLGVLHYFENGNEPDNNWSKGGGAYLFNPADFAAQSSADYDGDQGRLGATVGVKNADPNAKMVMGGLAMAGSGDAVTNATGYLDGMRAWADQHRGGSFPADVINVHQYCFGATASDPGVAPEACGLGPMMAELVAYRDAHLPGKELWLTEFGYDTDATSHLRAPAIGGSSAEVVQGQWLVRSILAVAEAGVDRATVFVSRDGCTGDASTCPSHGVQFTTSGVWSDNPTGNVPKVAYFYLASFRSALSGLRFAGTRDSGRSDVRIDAFADSTGKGAYVVWAPSSSGATVAGYPLAVPGASAATRVQLVDQSTSGQSSSVSISSGTVSIDVSETPTIVQVDRVE